MIFCRIVAFALMVVSTMSLAQANSQQTREIEQLSDAGEWEAADRMLATAEAQVTAGSELSVRIRVATAAAVLAMDKHSYLRRDAAEVERRLSDLHRLVSATKDPKAGLIIQFLDLRRVYNEVSSGGSSWSDATSRADVLLNRAQALGDRSTTGWTRFYRGLIDQMQGKADNARASFGAALADARRQGDVKLESFLVRHMAFLDQEAGHLEAAEVKFRASLDARRRVGLKIYVPFSLLSLADVVKARGREAEGRALVEEALAESEKISPRAHYYALAELAGLAIKMGKTGEANSRFQQAIHEAEAFGDASSVERYRRSMNGPGRI